MCSCQMSDVSSFKWLLEISLFFCQSGAAKTWWTCACSGILFASAWGGWHCLCCCLAEGWVNICFLSWSAKIKTRLTGCLRESLPWHSTMMMACGGHKIYLYHWPVACSKQVFWLVSELWQWFDSLSPPCLEASWHLTEGTLMETTQWANMWQSMLLKRWAG